MTTELDNEPTFSNIAIRALMYEAASVGDNLMSAIAMKALYGFVDGVYLSSKELEILHNMNVADCVRRCEEVIINAIAMNDE